MLTFCFGILKHKRRKERKERKKERKERKRRRKLERNENEAGMERIGHDDNKHENGKDKFGGDYSGKCELPPANWKMKFYAAAEKSPASPHANGKVKFSASPSQVTPQKMESDVGDPCYMGKGKFVANENLKASMSTFERSMLKTEAKYRELIVDWVPPPMELVSTEVADEEWLYRENVSGSKTTKTKHVSNDTGNGIYQGIQPHAHYLPDADIYALPYTLPF